LEVSAEPSPPLCTVIICAYNSRYRIDAALRSLRAQDLDEPFEVIAVVSGNDGAAEHLADQHPHVRIIACRHRLYPGAARNAGIRASRGAFIAFLPDDGIAEPAWLRARAAKHRLGYPLVAGAVSNATHANIVGTAGYYVEYAASMPVQGLLERQSVPHTLSYQRAVFELLGGFPEVAYPGEDTLFNARCVAEGLEVAYEPRACIGHVNLTSFCAFLKHQAQHGRGLAHCILEHNLDGPYNPRSGTCRMVFTALVGYPSWRWRKTLSLLTGTTSVHVMRYLVLTPIVIAGYLAGGLAALRELWRWSPGEIECSDLVGASRGEM
jgi:cellulose synthase/poly-beta-1,6-N-acetylglucosamine synthase-like glycosyltransferase